MPFDPLSGLTAEPEPWRLFASAILEAEALRRRVSGVLPRDFAGLVIDDAEVDRLLAELPGLDGGDARADLAGVEAQVGAQVTARRMAFLQSLGGAGTFERIAWQARLDATSAEVLALVAAVELSPQLQRLVGYVQDNVSAPRLWVSTLQRLIDRAPRAVHFDGALRRGELVQVEETGPWATRVVSLPEGVAWALSGVTTHEAALPRRAYIIEATSEADESGGEPADFVLVSGGDRTSRLRVASAALRGDRVLVTPVPASDDAWRAVIREATLGGLAVAVEVEDGLPSDAPYWVERAAHLAWALCSAKELALEDLPRRPWVERRAPEGFARPEDWDQALGRQPEDRHRLDAEQLRLVASAYSGVGGDLDAAVRRLASGHLDSLAVRIRPRRAWDDLVLPEQQATQLLCKYSMVLTFAVTLVFIGQVYYLSLGPVDYIVIALAAVLASIATVGMPVLVGIGMLALVAEPLGLPFSAISILILATFPIIDPGVTVANVYLNAATGVMVAGRASEEPIESASAVAHEVAAVS